MNNILLKSSSKPFNCFPDELLKDLLALNRKLYSWQKSKEYLASILLYYRLKRIEFELKRLYKDFERDVRKENDVNLESLKRNVQIVSLLFGNKLEKSSDSKLLPCNVSYTFPSNIDSNVEDNINEQYDDYFKHRNFTFITTFEKVMDEAKEMIKHVRIEYIKIKKNESRLGPPNGSNLESLKKALNDLIKFTKFFNQVRGRQHPWSLLYPFPGFLEQGLTEEGLDEEDRKEKHEIYNSLINIAPLSNNPNSTDTYSHKSSIENEKIRKNQRILMLSKKIDLQFIYECIHIDKNISIASLLLDASPIVANVVKRWCNNETDIAFLNDEYVRGRHKLLAVLYREPFDEIENPAVSSGDRENVTESPRNGDEMDLPALDLCFSMDNSLRSNSLHKNLSHISECKISMFTPTNLIRCGISLNETLYHMNYSIQELKKSNISACELKREGVSLLELLKGRYSPRDLREASYSVREINDALKLASMPSTFSIVDYFQAGYDAYDLRQGGFVPTDFLNNSLLSDIKRKNSDCQDPKDRMICLEKQISNQKREFTISNLRKAGYSCEEIFEAGYSCQQLKDAGFNLQTMLSTQLFSLKDLVLAGFKALDFYMAGIPASNLIDDSLFNMHALVDAGYSQKELNVQKEKIGTPHQFPDSRSTPTFEKLFDRLYLNYSYQSTSSFLKQKLIDGDDNKTYGSLQNISNYQKVRSHIEEADDITSGYIELKNINDQEKEYSDSEDYSCTLTSLLQTKTPPKSVLNARKINGNREYQKFEDSL